MPQLRCHPKVHQLRLQHHKGRQGRQGSAGDQGTWARRRHGHGEKMGNWWENILTHWENDHEFWNYHVVVSLFKRSQSCSINVFFSCWCVWDRWSAICWTTKPTGKNVFFVCRLSLLNHLSYQNLRSRIADIAWCWTCRIQGAEPVDHPKDRDPWSVVSKILKVSS